MKRARIAFDGRLHELLVRADAPDDVVTLPDGRLVTAADVVWLPPIEPRTGFALAINYADHAKEL